MNKNVIEREMVYARAKIYEEQKPILNAYFDHIMRRSFIVGILVGSFVGMAGLLAAMWVWLNFFL